MPRRKPLIPQTEHQIQTAILGFLRFNGYYAMRLNSGKIPVGEGRARRLIQMSEAGTPDIMAFRMSKPNVVPVSSDTSVAVSQLELLFIEVKRPGNKPTTLQQIKMNELEEHGARCIVAHSVDEIEEALK